MFLIVPSSRYQISFFAATATVVMWAIILFDVVWCCKGFCSFYTSWNLFTHFKLRGIVVNERNTLRCRNGYSARAGTCFISQWGLKRKLLCHFKVFIYLIFAFFWPLQQSHWRKSRRDWNLTRPVWPNSVPCSLQDAFPGQGRMYAVFIL